MTTYLKELACGSLLFDSVFLFTLLEKREPQGSGPYNRKNIFQSYGTLCTMFDDWMVGPTLQNIPEIVIDTPMPPKHLSLSSDLSLEYLIYIFNYVFDILPTWSLTGIATLTRPKQNFWLFFCPKPPVCHRGVLLIYLFMCFSYTHSSANINNSIFKMVINFFVFLIFVITKLV